MARLFRGLLVAPWIAMTQNKRMRFVSLKLNKDLAYMNELFEAGKVIPVIDRIYTLAEVPEAFRHFGDACHRGKW